MSDTNSQETHEQPIVAVEESSGFSGVYVTLVVKFVSAFALFIWYFLKNLVGLVYSSKKVIRNQVVLITGSGGSLGKKE